MAAKDKDTPVTSVAPAVNYDAKLSAQAAAATPAQKKAIFAQEKATTAAQLKADLAQIAANNAASGITTTKKVVNTGSSNQALLDALALLAKSDLGSGNKSTSDSSSTVTTYTAPDGRIFTDLNAYNSYIDQLKREEKTRQGQSAYDLLFEQFNQYGMGALVEPLKQFIQEGLSSSEFTLRLRNTDAYKKRFAANAQRIAKGLSALNEAEYIGLEDQYQNIMRQYGLPASYYARGDMGRQEGFEKFLANDVSAAELEDRVMTAQDRLLNASPEIMGQLKGYYNISDGDILAYVLDPQNALTQIKRRVQAAEIGAGAFQAGLQTGVTRAEELAAAGVTKQQAQQGFQTVAEVAPRGGQLAAMYGESPYTQQTAEQEVFGLAGSVEAAKQRKKLIGLEKAAFSGQTGAAQGALGRERAGNL